MPVRTGNDGVHKLALQVWGVGRLLLGVVCGLLGQGFQLQQLAQKDVVDVNESALVGQIATDQQVHLGDNFVVIRF